MVAVSSQTCALRRSSAYRAADIRVEWSATKKATAVKPRQMFERRRGQRSFERLSAAGFFRGRANDRATGGSWRSAVESGRRSRAFEALARLRPDPDSLQHLVH